MNDETLARMESQATGDLAAVSAILPHRDNVKTLAAAYRQLAQLKDDLVTIVDFCHEMTWADDDFGQRAIVEAHDLAHVLEGGDRTITPWAHLLDVLDIDGPTGEFTAAWPDVRRRMLEILQRPEATS